MQRGQSSAHGSLWKGLTLKVLVGQKDNEARLKKKASGVNTAHHSSAHPRVSKNALWRAVSVSIDFSRVQRLRGAGTRSRYKLVFHI